MSLAFLSVMLLTRPEYRWISMPFRLNQDEGGQFAEWNGNGKREIEEKTIFNFRDSIILRDGHSRLLSFSEWSVLLLKTQLNYWDLGQKWVCPKFWGNILEVSKLMLTWIYSIHTNIADWPLTYIWIINLLLHLECFLCCQFGRTLKNHLRNQWLKMSWFILVWNLCDCCDVG